MKRTSDVVFDDEPRELPDREIEILPPFNIQSFVNGERTILEHGNRYTVSGEFAAELIATRRAVDPSAPKPVVRKPERAPAPKLPGKTVRVRIIDGCAIRGYNGEILGAGEHSVPIELVSPFDGRMVLVGAKPRPKRKHFGPPHPVRVVSRFGPSGVEGAGICIDGEHVPYGTELEVPESLAEELFFAGTAASLKPELPDPRAEQLAELIAGDDDGKRDKALSLATMIFARDR